jgi:hypothetical protein
MIEVISYSPGCITLNYVQRIEIGVTHDFLWEMDKLAKNSHFRTKEKDVLIK